MLSRLALVRPLRPRGPLASRALHLSAPRCIPAGDGGPSTKTPDPSNFPQTTQGHTTTKSHGLDVQNDNANAGQAARDNAGSSKGQGGGQGPIDAARMDGGESKTDTTEGTGPFKDQVGGQDQGAGDGVKKGGKTEVPKGGWMGKIGNALSGNKAFHTSARASADAREPVESDLAGEQNEHLKHKKASDSDAGKGNAAPEPHLPSHQKHKNSGDGAQSQTAEQTAKNPAQAGKASGAPKGFAAFHSSARSGGQKERDGPEYAAAHEPEPKGAGYNAPPEALPANLESTYNRAEATPPPQPNMTPSSEAAYSSSAVDPPNEALRKQVKDGTLPASNPQPTAEGGRQGLGEAWKNRK